MKKYVMFLFLGFLSWSQPAKSEISVGLNLQHLKWKFDQTQHFKIIYHEGVEKIAAEAAVIAEEVYEPVTAHLKIKPSKKITLIISDFEDVSNGLAYVNGHYIFIWAKPYTKYTTGTMRWLRRALTHEIVHEFHYQGVRNFLGIPWELFALGTTPTWFTEGIAQYEAERWDAHRDLLLRVAVSDNALLNRARLEGFMAGDRIDNRLVYEQGHSLVRYIAQKYGEEKIGEIIKSHRKFPLSFNWTLQRTLGVSESRLIRDWHAEISRHYRQHFESQDHLGKTCQPFQHQLQAVYSLNWSPGGKFAAVVGIESYTEPTTRLYLFDSQGKKIKTLDGPGINSQVCWSPNGHEIVYSKKRRGKHGAMVDDLFILNIETNKKREITVHFRASDPAWSPDGKQIVFCQGIAGQSQLIRYSFTDDSFEPLLPDSEWPEVFAPAWHPDGKQLAVSVVDKNGWRDIVLINADGSEFRYLTRDSVDDRNAVWSPDGNKLAWVSYQNDLPNLYTLDLETGNRTQLTNVYGGVFHPAWHVDGQAISVVTFEDRDSVHVYSIPVNSTVRQKESAAKVPWHQAIPSNAVPIEIIPEITDNSIKPTLISRNYHPLVHVRSQMTLPNIDVDDGGYQIGFYNLLADPVGRHEVAWSVTQGKRTHFFADYYNRQFLPSLHFTLAQRSYDRGTYLEEELWEKVFDAGLTVSLPINSGQNVYANHLVWLNATAQKIDTYNSEVYDKFVAWVRPFSGWMNSAAIGYAYSSLRPSLDHSINPDAGFQVSLYTRRFDKALGSDLISTQYSASAVLRIRSFFRKHILATRLISFNHFGDQRYQSRYALGSAVIRGLDHSQEGSQILALQTEYRLPLIQDVGLKLWFLYLEKICMAGFFDVGKAWGDELTLSAAERRYVWIKNDFKDQKVRGTFGAEMRLRFFLAGKISFVLRGGIGKRWDRSSQEPEKYFLLGPVF